MKRKISIILICILALGTVGCRKTPDNSIVIGKGDATLEKAIAQEDSTVPAVYAAPEHWDDTIAKDDLIITVDADVGVPDAGGFPSAVITTGEISQQTADNIMNVLLDGAALYEYRPDYPYTKEEINEEILLIKQSISDPNSDFNEVLKKGSDKYNEMLAEKQKKIEELEEAYESAPETIEIKPADTIFQRAENPDLTSTIYLDDNISEEERKRREEENSMAAEAAGGTDYHEIKGEAVFNNSEKASLFISNTSASFLMETWENVENAEDQKRYGIPVTEGGITEDEAREKAVKVIKEIGIDYLDIADFEESYYIERDAEGMAVSKRPCYTFYFMRSINGVTENYALAKDAPLMEGQYKQMISNESVKITVGKEGIIIFQWLTPTQLTEMKSRNVNVLQFEDIQDVFRKQIIIDNIYTSISEITTILERNIVIEKAKLGLMRVLRQGSENEYLMIPVWDFYGYEVITFEDPETAREMQFDVNENGEYMLKNMYQSYLTINAIDGSIIDRQQGY